jgi:hypothetical protein
LAWNLSVQVEDPTVAKYVSMGLNKEAVVMAIRTFGDIQNKVWFLSFPLCLGMVLVSLSMSTAARTISTQLFSLCSHACQN